MKRVLARTWPALLLALALGGGCAKNDLGTPCQLIEPTASGNEPLDPSQMNASLDYISTGGADCEDFTCVDTAGDVDQSGAPIQGYCSRRCIEDAQCQGGVDTDLSCRKLNLDQAFIDTLRQRLGDEEFRKLVGDITTDRYCAHPEP